MKKFLKIIYLIIGMAATLIGGALIPKENFKAYKNYMDAIGANPVLGFMLGTITMILLWPICLIIGFLMNVTNKIS